jgi:hypothetical protein
MLLNLTSKGALAVQTAIQFYTKGDMKTERFPYMQTPHHEAVTFLTSQLDEGDWPGSHSGRSDPGNEATVFTGEQTERAPKLI